MLACVPCLARKAELVSRRLVLRAGREVVSLLMRSLVALPPRLGVGLHVFRVRLGLRDPGGLRIVGLALWLGTFNL